MKIDCWDCKFFEYKEYWDGEDETRVYMCKHPNGTGHCPLPKYAGLMGDCALLDGDADRATGTRNE